jgi:hypothetical protein
MPTSSLRPALSTAASCAPTGPSPHTRSRLTAQPITSGPSALLRILPQPPHHANVNHRSDPRYVHPHPHSQRVRRREHLPPPSTNACTMPFFIPASPIFACMQRNMAAYASTLALLSRYTTCPAYPIHCFFSCTNAANTSSSLAFPPTYRRTPYRTFVRVVDPRIHRPSPLRVSSGSLILSHGPIHGSPAPFPHVYPTRSHGPMHGSPTPLPRLYPPTPRFSLIDLYHLFPLGPYL